MAEKKGRLDAPGTISKKPKILLETKNLIFSGSERKKGEERKGQWTGKKSTTYKTP